MTGGAVARRVALPGDNKCRRIGAPVEEELCDDVERQHRTLIQVLVTEPQDAKYYSQTKEANYLQRFPTECVDGQHCCPISGKGPRDSEHNIPHCVVV